MGGPPDFVGRLRPRRPKASLNNNNSFPNPPKPCTTLGRPLVSPGFAGCLVPGLTQQSHRSSPALLARHGVKALLA